MKLFSGTANPKLSKEVASLLKLPLAHAEVIRFDNSEVRVRIEEDVKNQICIVIQPTANPTDTNLMELFFYCDALRRQEAAKVIGVVPYFGYARQDIQHRVGECVSSNVVIKFMESIGFHKVYTIDIHDEATQGVFTIPFKNVSAFPILAAEIRNFLKNNIDSSHIAVVSPDQGGIERARKFGEMLLKTADFKMVVIEKNRDQNAIHQSKALDLYGNVKDKTAIIVDDLVTSGGTLIHAAELCMQYGAKNVFTAIAHHDFSERAPRRIQDSIIEKFFTTNSILLKNGQDFSKLQEASVASLIAEELQYLK